MLVEVPWGGISKDSGQGECLMLGTFLSFFCFSPVEDGSQENLWDGPQINGTVENPCWQPTESFNSGETGQKHNCELKEFRPASTVCVCVACKPPCLNYVG